jgi:hypothetical protein
LGLQLFSGKALPINMPQNYRIAFGLLLIVYLTYQVFPFL